MVYKVGYPESVRKVKSEIEERKEGTRFRGAGATFKLIEFWRPGKAGCLEPKMVCLGLGEIEQENWDFSGGSMGYGIGE